MIHRMFAVYDSKSEAFGMPMFQRSIAEAIRSFTDAAADSNTMLFKHPGDYTLFEIGEYNQITGVLDCLPTPRSLGLLVELLPKKN